MFKTSNNKLKGLKKTFKGSKYSIFLLNYIFNADNLDWNEITK